MKKVFCVFIILILLSLSACGKNKDEEFDLAAYKEFYGNVITTQEEYLKSLQLESGAFVKWTIENETNEVVPYFACFTGIALLENPDNASLVKKYIDWHFSAINRMDDYNGLPYTIYDYSVNNGELTPKSSYDSVDSYAALFLILLEKYAEVTNDSSFITEKFSDIQEIANAMLSTKKDGLTAAKPDNLVYYTMDNSEVYSGLKAAERLMQRIGQTAEASHFSAEAKELKSKINGKLYNKFLRRYKPHAESLWVKPKVFYPDGACQIYPALFSVTDINDKRSKRLMDELINNYSNTEYKKQIDFPWVIIAYAAVLHGKYDFASRYLQESYDKYMKTNAYPWYSMEGAMAYLTASELFYLAEQQSH